ncbi:SH3 domain-containing protein [Proteiniclasticum ruminis]|uniref:Uncharacterized conserved protein YkwD, contains CAP (CSP/antigen 5/PR1) domain n=1 Tax=Proteiniclasticum ruminis TaxID=398199 RepID=A0A1I5BFE8_9CLOT|nr:CAP domain-containing protein [Proteiniclasticum ruminis]SFN73412.1 Uncharacterized conserved protein YkwD, contains CAP (CSP/antigen 5/PR1) domain [Proteiniclasticum ruminis]
MKKIKVLSLMLSSLVLFSCTQNPFFSKEESVKEHPEVQKVEKVPENEVMEPVSDHTSLSSRRNTAESPEESVKRKEEPLTFIKHHQVFFMKMTGNLRQGPGIQYEILQVIYEGEKIETLEKVSNGWYKVQYGSEEGYLSGILLTEEEPLEISKETTAPVKEPVETPSEKSPSEQALETASKPQEQSPGEETGKSSGETSPLSTEKTLASDEVRLQDATMKHQREVRHIGLRVNAIEVPDDTHPYGTILEMVSKPGIYKKGETIDIKIAVASDKKAYFSTADKSLPQNYKSVVHKNLEEEILKLLNAYRRENGLKELILKEDLMSSARYKSESMLQHDYFAHYNPHLEYISFGDLMNFIFGYTHYTKKGENLFANMGTEAVSAQVIFEGWKNSPSHNKAMLDPEYIFVGVGVITAPVSGTFYGGKYVTLATQHFGK